MKALRAAPFLFAFAVPVIAVVGYLLGGWWTFLAIAYGYILQPIGDTIAGRHSSHHLNETAHFEGLGDSPDTPQLPAGYGASILLAMIPPLWRRVMDPRVAKANAA